MKNVLSWAWRITICLFVIAVALIAFHTAQTPFQTAVISGLVLIFVYANARQRLTLVTMIDNNKAAYVRFVETLRALDSPKAEEYANEGKKLLSGDDVMLNGHWLYIVTDSLISLLALYQLIAEVV